MAPISRRQIFGRIRVPLMLSGVLIVVLVLFVGGLLLGLMQSFGYMPALGGTRFTLEHYVNVLGDSRFLDALALTTRLSIVTTLLTAVLAVICALALRQPLKGKRLVTFIFQLNIPLPHILGAISAIFLLSQSGLAARMAFQAGLIEGPADFPALVFDKNLIGVGLIYAWKGVPFIGVILLAVLQSTAADYEDLARTLGASQLQRLWYVVLPLIMPGLLRGAILVFAAVFSSYALPFLLGAAYPKALAVLAFEYYSNVDLGFRNEAMAMSAIMAVLITILTLLYMRLAAYVRRE